MSDTRTLQAEVVLGDDMQKWLESDVGQYMVAGFESDERAAMAALATIWPWRWRRISQLQERIRMCRRFSSMAAEAIISGRQALAQLQHPQE